MPDPPSSCSCWSLQSQTVPLFILPSAGQVRAHTTPGRQATRSECENPEGEFSSFHAFAPESNSTLSLRREPLPRGHRVEERPAGLPHQSLPGTTQGHSPEETKQMKAGIMQFPRARLCIRENETNRKWRNQSVRGRRCGQDTTFGISRTPPRSPST